METIFASSSSVFIFTMGAPGATLLMLLMLLLCGWYDISFTMFFFVVSVNEKLLKVLNQKNDERKCIYIRRSIAKIDFRKFTQ